MSVKATGGDNKDFRLLMESVGFENAGESKVIEFLRDINLDPLNLDFKRVASDLLNGRDMEDTMTYLMGSKKYSSERARDIYNKVIEARDLRNQFRSFPSGSRQEG